MIIDRNKRNRDIDEINQLIAKTEDKSIVWKYTDDDLPFFDKEGVIIKNVFFNNDMYYIVREFDVNGANQIVSTSEHLLKLIKANQTYRFDDVYLISELYDFIENIEIEDYLDDLPTPIEPFMYNLKIKFKDKDNIDKLDSKFKKDLPNEIKLLVKIKQLSHKNEQTYFRVDVYLDKSIQDNIIIGKDSTPDSWFDDLCIGENGILVFRKFCFDELEVINHSNILILSELQNLFEIIECVRIYE